jgi:hypothetical protein
LLLFVKAAAIVEQRECQGSELLRSVRASRLEHATNLLELRTKRRAPGGFHRFERQNVHRERRKKTEAFLQRPLVVAYEIGLEIDDEPTLTFTTHPRQRVLRAGKKEQVPVPRKCLCFQAHNRVVRILEKCDLIESTAIRRHGAARLRIGLFHRKDVKLRKIGPPAEAIGLVALIDLAVNGNARDRLHVIPAAAPGRL